MPLTPPPAPQAVNAGDAIAAYIASITNPSLQQQLLQAEQNYRSQYNNLNLQDYQQYLLGGQTRQFNADEYLASRPDLVANYNSDPGYAQIYGSLQDYARADAQGNPQGAQAFYGTQQLPGALDLSSQAATQQGQLQSQLNTQQRTADIADVEALGGRASQAFLNANPQLQAQLQQAQGLSSSGNPFAGVDTTRVDNFAGLGATGADPYAAFRSAVQQRPEYANLSPERIAAQNVTAGQVGQGQLGGSLYQQALDANQESAVTANLRQQAERLAQSTGALTGLEQRAIQQGSREGFAARGLTDSNRSIQDEIGARIAAQRSRVTEDLGLAAGINSQLLGAQQANRSFATGVYGQELGRGFSNVGNTLQADMANQGANLNAAQFNSQQGLYAQEQNRAFQAQQEQQYLQNLGLLGQADSNLMNQNRAFQLDLGQARNNQLNQDRSFQLGLGQANSGQLQNDRSYALGLAGATGQYASDPFQAILGRTSQAGAMGQSQFNNAAGLAGASQGPQLFNPDAGVNLALQNNANQANYQASIFGSQAANAGAQSQAKSSLFGGLLSGIGSLAGGILGIK